MEALTDFFPWAPNSLQIVTASMIFKGTLWKESYDKLRQHIKKQRHHFADKGPYSQSYGFSSSHVQLWVGPKRRRLSTGELMLSNCGSFKLRVPWTATISNQSILKETNPEYSLKRWLLKLKPKYFGHLMQRDNCIRPWCRERLRAGGEGHDRGWDDWMTSLTRWT